MRSSPGEQLDRVAEDVRHGLERFHCTPGGPRDVEDEAAAAGSRHAAGERPSGLTERMASARPGASRSITAHVASGVTSVGEDPVPPAVTTSPPNPVDSSAERPRPGRSHLGQPADRRRGNRARPGTRASSSPDRSSRRPDAGRFGNREDLRIKRHVGRDASGEGTAAPQDGLRKADAKCVGGQGL